MQAPGFRLNEREANPNPYVGFIRALTSKADHADAETILKAVAAQMKNIMRDRFMFVHTLEEAAYNTVFAGRNWNHGQSIELVLRNKGGRFLPLSYITSVMCHEMAHIEEMNHGPKFQKLMAAIKQDVKNMQARGNYGDGFWSDGQRLRDSAKMGAEGLRPSDFPEYVCGVTAGDARSARKPRAGKRASTAQGLVKGEASVSSGRQTDYRRKAGRRVNVDMGQSMGRLDGYREITKEDKERRQQEINVKAERMERSGLAVKTAKTKAAKEWNEENPWYTKGNTQGKVAKSKTAAELRAAAAEKRLQALSGSKTSTSRSSQVDDSEDELESSDEDIPDPCTNPATRKREMEDEMDDEERNELRGGWEELFPIEARERRWHGKRPHSPDMDAAEPTSKVQKSQVNAKSGPIAGAQSGRKNGFGAGLVDSERKRALGLESTTLTRTNVIGTSEAPSTSLSKHHAGSKKPVPLDDGSQGWACKVCTYVNLMDHGRCDMCQARPGETILPE